MQTTFDLTKPIAIGCDHAGVEYKDATIQFLQEKGYIFKDFGTHGTASHIPASRQPPH